MGLNDLGDEIAQISLEKGFTCEEKNIDQTLLLVVSEICEAQEELRTGRKITDVYWWRYPDDGGPAQMERGPAPEGEKPEGFPIEIADAIIRLLHLGRAFNIDLDAVVRQKINYNKSRPHRHGKMF